MNEDCDWCLTCNRKLDIEEPLIFEDNVFEDDDDEEVTISRPAPPPLAPKGQLKTRHGTVKARQNAHPLRKNVSSGRLAQKGKLGLSSAVNTALKQSAVVQKPEWAHLYCSEACMRVDEQRARLGLANLEPPKSPRFGPSSYAGSNGSMSYDRRGSVQSTSASPTAGRFGSSSNLQALTPLAGSSPMRIRQRSHSPSGHSQSEDLGGGRSSSYEPVPTFRLSSSVQSTAHSQPIFVGTLRPESAMHMRPASMGRISSSKSVASPLLTGTSVSAHAYEPPSPSLSATQRPPAHRSTMSSSSLRFDGSDPESPNSLFSRSSASTAPSSSKWVEEPLSLDAPHDPSKSPIHTGYGLYHRLPRRNASSSSLSRSPPANLHISPVTGLTTLSQSVGPASEPHGHTISDVFRAGQARRTASSASIAAMNPDGSATKPRRPPFLHVKQQSSASDNSDSSTDSKSPLPSPALVANGTAARLWSSGNGAAPEGRRRSFVYSAMPDSATIQRNSSEGDVRFADSIPQQAARTRRKKLFVFPLEDFQPS